MSNRTAEFNELFQMAQSIHTELADMRQTVDARLYDTRPTWERVKDLDNRVYRLETERRGKRVRLAAG